MACKYCGERDPLKLTMSTRMIRGKAVTVDVCLSCQWREKFGAEVTGNKMVKGMQYGKALRSSDWKHIYEDRNFLRFLGMFDKKR